VRAWASGVVAAMLSVGCGVVVQGRTVLSPVVPRPVVVPGTLDGHVLLAEASAHATEAGAGPLSIVATGETAERERMGAFVEVPDGMCLLGYGRASRSVEDLDLAAFSDEGTPLAVDDAPDAHPTLLVCPPHPSRVYLAAVAASGEGLVAVGAQLVLPARAAVVAKAMSAHGTRTASSRAAEAWPGLDDHVRRHHDAEGGTWEVSRKIAVAVDARVPATIAFPLEADGCTDALVVPDEDVGALDVEALDDHGRLVARGGASDRDRAVTVCSEAAWTGTLTVRPHVGQGLVAIVLSHGRGDIAKRLTAAPDLAWAAATLPTARARAERDAELVKAGYVTATGALDGVLLVGSTRSTTPALPLEVSRAQPCWRFDVVGGAPAALLEATAWDDTGTRLGAAEGASSATVFACGTRKPRIDIDARARAGPFAVMWRPERWADPAFATHSVAASRMLTRLASGPSSLLEGGAWSARALHIDGGHEASWSEVLPASACVHVALGAEGEGAGLVARVVDVATGDELDRSHGGSAAILRACAPEGALRTLVVRVAVTAGTLDVVVGERIAR